MTKKSGAVEFRNITKQYGAVKAVNDVSFTIEPGTLATLLGPSGCGKTTTLRMIAGLEMASQGQIFIGGEDVTRRSASQRDVSMVFQSYALFPHMTTLDNVAYGPTMQGKKRREAHEMASEKLALVGLAGFEGRLPSELSGGQQQRVALARALVLEPQVLLFDEPLSNLDAKLRRQVREDIRQLQLDLKLTVAYVTHDQEEALAVSDKVIVMSNSRIAQIGTPHELYNEPLNLFVADFIGDANILEARLERRQGDLAEIRLGEHQLKLPHRGAKEGSVKLAIRPDAISYHTMSSGIAAEITKASYLGRTREYWIHTEVGDLFVTQPGRSEEIPVGTRLGVQFDPAGVVVLASD